MKIINNKIAIYGGSFNPPTKGHIEVIKTVSPYVDEVWVIPVKNHAWNKELVSFEDRINMLSLIYNDGCDGKVKIIAVQGMKKVPQKTQPFMKWLKKNTNQDNEYHIVIGSDNAVQINKWYKWKQLCKENKFIIVKRGSRTVNFDTKPFNGSIMCLNDECESGCSSTEIRGMINDNWMLKEAEKWVHPKVMNYIKEKKLYGYKNNYKRR